ncbi:hypothetical protein [Imtechella halotolerans]|uniref:Riboflavin synthase subunit beta n=1 Tax=Imtechella halotolerans K1 TaxID=946077 RepID=I0W7L6_9FLAO|nr:hypothetical protein [Imtechella halotolerans]EID72382.1 hypothetical protein W5A_12781 [Imtechella halotolerans K1]WMQ64483.1 hypothetical protein PT603_05750 [Imtechella halotolerans]
MRFKVFKLRENKRYNYTPRYYQGKDVGNPYSFESKFHKYREATNANDFGSQWKAARESSRNRGNREVNRRLVIIFLVLLLVALYFLDFDLSIFSFRR